MTLLKAASPTASSKRQAPLVDGSRGTSLRRARARTKPMGRRAGLKPKLILASASPRRLQLLAQVGIEPDALRPVSIDETPNKNELPRVYAVRMAREKAEAARDAIADDPVLADSYVLAADTVVAFNSVFGFRNRILVKPESVEEAIASLRLLSGRSHLVYTAIHLIAPDDQVRKKVVLTRVRFKRLTQEEIDAYVASREWRGKAGGYAIQGLAGSFVQRLKGSYTNVVGLPVREVVQLLSDEGMPVYFNWLRLGEADLD